MSDERLRQLERKWRESGAVGDDALFLLERVRVGVLPAERLRVAAYCGHAAARAALGYHALGPLEPQQLLDWVHGVPDPSARLRLALFAGREVLDHFNRAFPANDLARRALSALELWLDTGTPEASGLLTALGGQLDQVAAELEGTESSPAPNYWRALAGHDAAEAIAHAVATPSDGALAAASAVAQAASAGFHALCAAQPNADPPWPNEAVASERRRQAELALKQVLAEQLAGWALG